jgi:translation initiation factor IF-3
VVAVSRARELARESGLDLVEVAPNSNPPVCRIMDYGKYRYQQSKKHSHRKMIDVKEVKIRPAISEHDLELKVKNILRFLDEGNKAKVTMFFRGREIVRPEIGMRIFDRITEIVGDKYNIEVKPRLEGNRVTMVVAPK